jgi:hypothetical protein
MFHVEHHPSRTQGLPLIVIRDKQQSHPMVARAKRSGGVNWCSSRRNEGGLFCIISCCHAGTPCAVACVRNHPECRQAPRVCRLMPMMMKELAKNGSSFVDTTAIKDTVKDTLWITVLYWSRSGDPSPRGPNERDIDYVWRRPHPCPAKNLVPRLRGFFMKG